MEYYRTEKGQIYADFAYRQLRIIDQYERMSIGEEKFEATLYVTVLQSLLTNCQEYVRSMGLEMSRAVRHSSIFSNDIESVGWGLRKNCWVENNYYRGGLKEKQDLGSFITRIRNSVSHPTEIDIKSEIISTGYTTIKDGSGTIKKFRFVDSDDIRNNRRRSYSERDVKNFLDEKLFPDEVNFIEEKGRFFPFINSKPFMRIAIIDLSVEELASLVKNLANYLAQPVQENWDGKTIKWLLAA